MGVGSQAGVENLSEPNKMNGAAAGVESLASGSSILSGVDHSRVQYRRVGHQVV